MEESAGLAQEKPKPSGVKVQRERRSVVPLSFLFLGNEDVCEQADAQITGRLPEMDRGRGQRAAGSFRTRGRNAMLTLF